MHTTKNRITIHTIMPPPRFLVRAAASVSSVLSSHDLFNFLYCDWDDGEIFCSIPRHQHVVLQPASPLPLNLCRTSSLMNFFLFSSFNAASMVGSLK